jgi:hypothetical protein
MSPTKLKMQPTIHLQNKPGYCRRPCPGSLCKCIVGCVFKSVRLVITREILCILSLVIIHPTYLLLLINKNVFHYTMRNDSFQKFTRMVSYLFENCHFNPTFYTTTYSLLLHNPEKNVDKRYFSSSVFRFDKE